MIKLSQRDYDLEDKVNQLEEYLEKKYPVELWIVYDELRRGLQINSIIVDKQQRSKGIGSAVMKEIIDFADKHNIDIVLTPSKDFGGSLKRLEEFYKNFGFKKNKSDMRWRETRKREPKNENL